MVTEIPVPAVIVATEYPDPVPIGIAPLAGVVVTPVPPLATGSVPETAVVKSACPDVFTLLAN